MAESKFWQGKLAVLYLRRDDVRRELRGLAPDEQEKRAALELALHELSREIERLDRKLFGGGDGTNEGGES